MIHSFRLQVVLAAAACLPAFAASPRSYTDAVLADARGKVSISGAPVSVGATLERGEALSTAADAVARISMGAKASATLMSSSTMTVTGHSSEISLKDGSVLVRSAVGGEFRVLFPGASVIVKPDHDTAARCLVTTSAGHSQVTLQDGIAEIHSGSAPMILHPGQFAKLDLPVYLASAGRGAPEGGHDNQGSATVAGSVTRQIPSGSVSRGGADKPLVLNDKVLWEDVIHTKNSGRLQITLLDNSVLSVGARSEMKIVKHDPDTQQTEIDLTAGRFRADVQKITKSGGKFEVHTKTAVIGVVGTQFVGMANANGGTTVCGVEGITSVFSIAFPNTPPVQLSAGQCTTVMPGALPTTPTTNTTLMSQLESETNVAGGAVAGGTAAGAGAGAGAGAATATTIGTAVIVATGIAATATLSGLVASGVLQASSVSPQ